MIPSKLEQPPSRARTHKPGPTPVKANWDDETGVLDPPAAAVTGFRVGAATNDLAGVECPPLDFRLPLDDVGGFVVVVVVDVVVDV
jgi:hypothetical protein